MKKIYFISLLGICISCNSVNGIKYKYNDIIITRVDDDDRTYLYYGNYNADFEKAKACIVTKHVGGIGSGMQAYLVFSKDKTIKVINIDSYFQNIGTDTSKFVFVDFNNSIGEMMMKTNATIYDSIVKISDGIELERKENLQHRSQVIADYESK